MVPNESMLAGKFSKTSFNWHVIGLSFEVYDSFLPQMAYKWQAVENTYESQLHQNILDCETSKLTIDFHFITSFSMYISSGVHFLLKMQL